MRHYFVLLYTAKDGPRAALFPSAGEAVAVASDERFEPSFDARTIWPGRVYETAAAFWADADF